MNKLQCLILSLCASGLTACVRNESNYQNFQSYYSNYHGVHAVDYQALRYSQSYDADPSYNTDYEGTKSSPISHKDMDRSWVNSQNPKAYTIQIGESEKASQVANRIFQAPKSNRSAEIKYNREGREYYRGVYGSYNNYEEAQKALNNLPAEIKQGANIKPWSAVQENRI